MAIGASTELAGLSTSFYYAKSELAVDDVDSDLMAIMKVDSKDAKSITVDPAPVTVSVDPAPVTVPVSVYRTADELYWNKQHMDLNDWYMEEDTMAAIKALQDEEEPTAEQKAQLDAINKLFVSAGDGEDDMPLPALIDTSSFGMITLSDAEISSLKEVVDSVYDPSGDEAVVASNAAIDGAIEGIASDDPSVGDIVAGRKDLPVEVDPAPVDVVVDPAPVDVEIEPADPGNPAYANVRAGTTAYTGFGASVSVPAGEGTSFSIGYSTFKAETTAEEVKAGTMFHDGNDMVTPYGGGQSVKTSLIELGVSYDLGGGATLGASIDKKSVESVMISTVNGARVGKVEEADTTTLEAAISFSF